MKRILTFIEIYKNRQTTEICFESLIEKNETLFKLKTEKKSFIKNQINKIDTLNVKLTERNVRMKVYFD
jgi:hypothetical protein